jgi:4-hydroxybenzoate polyprenyltransferase
VLAVMGFYAAFLLIWGLLGQSVGLGPLFWLGIAVAAAQALWHGLLIKDRQRDGCFKAFRLNHWLGLTVCLGVVLG